MAGRAKAKKKKPGKAARRRKEAEAYMARRLAEGFLVAYGKKVKRGRWPYQRVAYAFPAAELARFRKARLAEGEAAVTAQTAGDVSTLRVQMPAGRALTAEGRQALKALAAITRRPGTGWPSIGPRRSSWCVHSRDAFRAAGLINDVAQDPAMTAPAGRVGQ